MPHELHSFVHILQEPIEVAFGEKSYVSQFSGAKRRKVARLSHSTSTDTLKYPFA